MKRSFKAYPHVAAFVPNRVKLAVTGVLGAMLVAGFGCTGVIPDSPGPSDRPLRGAMTALSDCS